jgi:type IV pilus assembly protein PilC
VFDNLSIAMVEAGEAGGVLDETLKRLAKLLEENARLQNQLKAAMGYPITVLVIAILVFLGMTIFLIPTFADIFDQLGAELPVFTQMMINLSKLLRSTFSIFLVGGIILGIYAFTRYNATPVGRRQVDGTLLKLPLFGDLLQKTASAQFCRTMSSLSKAGVPIMMSLEILHDTTNNAVVGDAIRNSRNDISEGVPLMQTS